MLFDIGGERFYEEQRIPLERGLVGVRLALIGGVGLVLIVTVLFDSCLTTDYP